MCIIMFTFTPIYFHLKLTETIIQTKWSERAKRAHSVLREVEKMGYKKFSPIPV